MRALVWHGRRDLRLSEIPDPPVPGMGQAVVAVSMCGICGTDLQEYLEGPVLIRAGAHPLTGAAPPFPLGHEFSGRVHAVGPDVEVAVGTRVTVDPCWRCGECFWCRRGDYQICRIGGAVGLASPGALAELVTVPAAGLVPLPDDVDDVTGALAEPVSVGLHAVDRGGVEVGSRVVIQGFGPIGAAVLLAARTAGAASIIVSEPLAARRDRALALGADEALDPAGTDVRQRVRTLTDMVGADVVFDTTGVSSLLAGALEITRRGGRLVVAGIGHGPSTFDPTRLVPFEREIVGTLGYRNDLPRFVELVRSGRLDPGGLVSAVVPLQDAIAGAFEVLASDRGGQLKVVVDMGAEQ